ncbi:MAG TPA: LysE family translocator [Pseudonocardiaceae bacterium]|jgi:threonine/homoserine/homoserine lactone efflux protein|nr:LysE family translocator [Pseudonocardiaceae bacterium]
MPIGSILAFWGVAALLIVVPGVDWAFTIGAGLRRQVLPAAAGIVLGYLVMTAVVAAGLGALIASTPVALTALTVAGALYLAWLGIGTVRKPGTLGTEDGPRSGRLGTLVKGMAVSGLNPKGLLIFVAVLPQFTAAHNSWPVPAQLTCLGLAFVATCALVYPCVGLAARGLLRTKPVVALVVSRVSGVAMIVIGLILLAEPIWGIVQG